ncbi:MAG TPA: class I SAM-dependent rRNA methyltransferase, partial [Deinococcales bacterium]|nr:class I SAM-dependent rRNA methyltransferase [Deinococcales bacterium]
TDFYARRIAEAISRRSGLRDAEGVRLVHAEADGLPGLVADRFGDFLSVQLRNAGLERHRDLVLDALRATTGAESAFERSDTVEREREGLPRRAGPLWGDVPDTVQFSEGGVRFAFSPATGQKTGFYLDQRDNRRLMAGLCGPGDRFLDVYSYTGAFALQAARAGAKALAVDKDPVALAALERQAARNGLSVDIRLGDALEVLDDLNRLGRTYTRAVVDPPTLAKRKDEVTAAKRVFTIACKNVLKMLEPGGLMLVTTCAYHLKLEDLLEAVRMAGGDAGRRLTVQAVTFQPDDHPWILQVPETLSLKSVLVQAE